MKICKYTFSSDHVGGKALLFDVGSEIDSNNKLELMMLRQLYRSSGSQLNCECYSYV